jgi:ferredoxin
MRIRVDLDRCTGHALCYGRAPDLFELDELGSNKHEIVDVPEDREDVARAAVAACPERAMTIDE